MIHYHGTPVSGAKIEHVRFFKGRHALVNYLYRDELDVVAELCQSFVFDSGAFGAWASGKKVDFDGYIAWCLQWCKHPGFDWALIPDVIDGSEEENDELIDAWPKEIEGVPVWHMHESIARLVALASRFRMVAIGSSGEWSTPGTKAWWSRINEVLPWICDADGRPFCKLHGLRMLNPKVFTKLPLSSADSTNAGVNAGSKNRFGQYVPVSSGVRAEIIAQRIEDHNSAAVFGGS